MATRAVLRDLARIYAARSGREVAIESVGGIDAAARVLAGEPFDVVVLACDVIGTLSASGHLLADSVKDLDALMRFQPATAAPQAAEPIALAATAGAPPARAPERESAPFVTRLLPEAPEAPQAPLDRIAGFVGIPEVRKGAGYRVRTDDIQLGKLTLYQLS